MKYIAQFEKKTNYYFLLQLLSGCAFSASGAISVLFGASLFTALTKPVSFSWWLLSAIGVIPSSSVLSALSCALVIYGVFAFILGLGAVCGSKKSYYEPTFDNSSNENEDVSVPRESVAYA